MMTVLVPMLVLMLVLLIPELIPAWTLTFVSRLRLEQMLVSTVATGIDFLYMLMTAMTFVVTGTMTSFLLKMMS